MIFTSSSLTRSRGAVVLFPTDFTGGTAQQVDTPEQSRPLAKRHSITPTLPSTVWRKAGLARASAPMVRMPYRPSFLAVAGPTYSRSLTGRAHTTCR